MKSKSMSKFLIHLLMCCVLAFSVALIGGCKGDTGAQGPAGPAGPAGPPGTGGAAAAANEQCLVCHGTGGIVDIAVVHNLSPLSATIDPLTVNANNTVDINEQSSAQLAGITLVGTVTSLPTVTPNPVVNFTVKDSAGHGIVGLGTANLRFAIVKLVSAATGTYWESYMVNSATARPSTETPTAVNPSIATAGTVTDNQDGSYSYTFIKNITTVTAGGLGGGAVAFDPNATHRLSIQVSGTVAGGSLNDKAVNILYDFVPAGGTPIARQIVTTAVCNTCHYKIGTTTPHGGRVDPNYCVVCHTYQRANGRSAQAPDASGALPAGSSTYIVSGQVDSAPTATAGGFAQGEFVTLIHKIHYGENLALQNENPLGVNANEVTYPQDARNCAKCHAGTQGANWMTNPSRKSCGACHDNVSFASTIPVGFVAHSGGFYADDTTCSFCHGATTGLAPIASNHVPVIPPDPTDPRLGGTNTHTNAEYVAAAGAVPSGAAQISYVVSSVTVTNNHPSITFALKSSLTGTLVFSAPTSTASELMPNFAGSPSAYFVWAEPQDGINTPADFNKSASAYIKKVWNGSITTSTITGPDGNGFYTLTMNGTTIPSTAVMVTGGIGYTYGSGSPPLVQTNLAAYPYNAATGAGGLSVPAPNVWKVASGYTGRRVAVDTAKCNACHAALGVAPTFHVGQRNDAPTCSFCHNPNRTAEGWALNASTFVHAIHGTSLRTAFFTWDATSTSGDEADDGFFKVTYPNLLNNCLACHVAGYYDFSAGVYTANNGALMKNLLLSTAATGTFSSTDPTKFTFSPYVDLDTNYGSAGSGDNLVTSPISAACFACHDATTTMNHMKAMGGVIYQKRSIAIPQP